MGLPSHCGAHGRLRCIRLGNRSWRLRSGSCGLAIRSPNRLSRSPAAIPKRLRQFHLGLLEHGLSRSPMREQCLMVSIPSYRANAAPMIIHQFNAMGRSPMGLGLARLAYGMAMKLQRLWQSPSSPRMPARIGSSLIRLSPASRHFHDSLPRSRRLCNRVPARDAVQP